MKYSTLELIHELLLQEVKIAHGAYDMANKIYHDKVNELPDCSWHCDELDSIKPSKKMRDAEQEKLYKLQAALDDFEDQDFH